MNKAYVAVFHFEESSYWVEFPDLPGCFSDGDTIEEAITNASAALGAHLCSMIERGLELPAPTAIQTVSTQGEDFASVVIADPMAFTSRTRAVKKTLTIPEWLNDEAEKRHINFSSVLKQALIAQLN